ncbi:hypothetical protein GCM10011349_24050 [Novosphingobium indicum]|uniref:HNH nuclease domain-containing protein n=1 Tax=Novosphingobium indicum TaxID=462949 RepID=A0ABQ2JRS9_9SPHN|nr:HNH endonuclease [Novosphingobium indicum]GGN51469.1 hypothetical protein GCM10011349_24050 [Novosphingobium indicum]
MLADLKPHRKDLVFDLVEEAGFDTTDWVESFKHAAGYKANPKYCYEWAYVQPGKLIILNLWHSNMDEEHGQIVHRGTFRADAEFRRLKGGKQQWVDRARRLDEALQVALRKNLPVRVIIVDGDRREKEAVDGPSSKVRFRKLDPEPWTITAYDWETGACELTRGILEGRFVDQFDLEQTSKSAPERREVTTSSFIRDPAVRRRVLARANGRCELCGEPGFKMASGAVYLETHHVVPLADGGDDHESNVVALCANDHRRAHFADNREEIARRFQVRNGGASMSVSEVAVTS